jgi:hypothetical protein
MTNAHESLYAEFLRLEQQAEILESALERQGFREQLEATYNRVRSQQSEIIESAARQPEEGYEKFIHRCLEKILQP